MSSPSKSGSSSYGEEDSELRRGPWTLEEDSLLIHYIAQHGEGRWNLLARCSGLKRTGKSCRLRWLNYLKPDVKRGNLTPEEQLVILELHSKWGNRWSKIAQHLPGRTDNEIKNYWRTRVQKQARHLKIDENSTKFRDAIRCFWMPRLQQKIEEEAHSSSSAMETQLLNQARQASTIPLEQRPLIEGPTTKSFNDDNKKNLISGELNCTSPISISSPHSMNISQFPHQISEIPTSPFEFGNSNPFLKGNGYYMGNSDYDMGAFNALSSSMSALGNLDNSASHCHMSENNWIIHGDGADNLCDMDDLW